MCNILPTYILKHTMPLCLVKLLSYVSVLYDDGSWFVVIPKNDSFVQSLTLAKMGWHCDWEESNYQSVQDTNYTSLKLVVAFVRKLVNFST